MHSASLFLSSVTLSIILTATINSQTIFVDQQLIQDCRGNYSIERRDCSGSDGNAYRSLSKASFLAKSGYNVVIRRGIYKEQLNPKHSGQPNNYIVFKNYQNEIVTISNPELKPAIWIFQKSYIAVEGLIVKKVKRWLNALGSHHLVINNNQFENALDEFGSSKTGLFFQDCQQVTISNNLIKNSTQDNLGMVSCDSNLIENNRIVDAQHALWAFKCSNNNVIRNNYFYNSYQKIGEIYDCVNAGFGDAEYPKLDILDRSKFNVVENNTFAFTPSPKDKSPYAGIQFAGQRCIIRHNIFYNCEGPPIDLTLYSDEAKYNYGNRIYNNIFYQNEFGGIQLSGITVYQFYDQIFKNNILYKNKFVQKDFRWDWYEELHNQPVQIVTGRVADFLFDHNNIFNEEEDELYNIAYGDRFSYPNPEPKPLSWWQFTFNTLFKDNVQQEPEFIDITTKDFHLRASSPMIDAGTFLTKTVTGQQQSFQLKVEDATWFTAGNRLQVGDTIQLEGQTEKSVITSIDYNKNMLSLKHALSWDSGQGVSLPYHQARPDMGAYEFVDNIVNVVRPRRNENSLSLFPNPASEYVHIQYEHYSDHAFSIKMIDIQGKSVFEKKDLHSSLIRLDLNTVKKGVYFIIITENQRVTGQDKLILH